MKRIITLFLYSFLCISGLFAQKTVSGTIFDEYLEPFSGAIISSSNGSTTSDYDGAFILKVKSFPITVKVSSIGYGTETLIVTEDNQEINVVLKETSGLDQVVISASRTPERIMESPVTIERIDNKYAKSTASPNFYEGLKNLKGIDIHDNNYLTKAVVSNRGFASVDNVRFVQLVDGVDTAVPVFDYSLGNTFGLNELDVKNVEILPGAASALYGANAFNGILLMTSKNPFEDQGISVYTKSGVTSADDRGSAGFIDMGVRMAHKFNDWFAAKININYDSAEDWLANDVSNINGIGNSHFDGDPSYDGINVYGDDFSLNLVDMGILLDQLVAGGVVADPIGGASALGLLAGIDNAQDIRVSRTGFNEADLIDYNMNNFRIDAALHFKPWGEYKTEIILGTKYSTGNNITQASNRYSQTGSDMQHYRLEFKGENYFFRAYYNENNAGSNYDTKLAGVYINDNFKDNGTFFTEYAVAYFQSIAAGLSNTQGHLNARNFVNSTQIDPNSAQFATLLDQAIATDISEGGARLFENSGFYNIDANYNFKDKIDFADIQIGGSFRSFALDSDGQVYTDYDGVLRYRQFGFYTQVQKKFADDRIKFTGTLRYDKSRNFEGNFTPRATLSFAAGKNKDHNFRIGFQTGFRNPTSLDQYAAVDLGNAVLIGSVNENLENFEAEVQRVSDVTQFETVTGTEAFENSFTASSVAAYQQDYRAQAIATGSPILAAGTANSALLAVSDFNKVAPELVRSYELGYRGAVDLGGSLFEYDLVGYYNFHRDFITATEVVVPLDGVVDDLTTGSLGSIITNDFERFIISTNTKSTINSYGFAFGFNTKLFDKFNFGASYAFADFTLNKVEGDVDFTPQFNTPKNSLKFQIHTDDLFKNFGLGFDVRWQDEFLYETRFVQSIIDSRFVIDGQMNYNIPSIKSFIKVGMTNLTGKDYIGVPESGTIGSQFYVSWTFNN